MGIQRVIRILKQGGIGILPTDTLYGLVGSALSKKTVERIYKVRKRKRSKPMIILIHSMRDLSLFGIRLDHQTLGLLKKLWPGTVSIILPCAYKKFYYLHRGKKTLAFRLPKNHWLRNLLHQTGPIVAPSANFAGRMPALSIKQAKNYFGENVDFYFDKGVLHSTPSNIIEIKR